MSDEREQYARATARVAAVIDEHAQLLRWPPGCRCGWESRDRKHTWSEHLAVLVLLETMKLGAERRDGDVSTERQPGGVRE